ncbi:flagellar export protein FliJ [Thermaerobacter subterraneus]|uniref:Flagellar FliJ protein n=1 Tax=Thermaerobacter subterraneus DSM 13965 TaxID=867903 RepID=K6PLD4_9FIRM|nr:flagellar FliJ family protein [Thermaerobacter subterraneus]EKP93677.1 Flagellar FliJ protein [Thermaerobacter subterraneus DSM 13965]
MAMASGEPFRLQRVWDVRRLEALARLGEWGRWQARAQQAQEEATLLEAQRRQAAGELAAVGPARPALEMVARWRELEHLGLRCQAAAGRAQVLRREAETRQQAAVAARREEQACERLYDRHQRRQRLEAARREQAHLDEVAGRRAAREEATGHDPW